MVVGENQLGRSCRLTIPAMLSVSQPANLVLRILHLSRLVDQTAIAGIPNAVRRLADMKETLLPRDRLQGIAVHDNDNKNVEME